jgi:hypothetical protein
MRVITFIALVLACANASANGVGENRSWQFSDPFSRAQKANVRALIEQKKANGFRSIYNSYSTSTSSTFDVAGDYVDCALVATTTGNESGSTQASTVGSPSVALVPGLNSSSQGNVSDTVSGGGQGATMSASGGGSLAPAASTTQSNSAPLTSTLDNNTISSSVGRSTGSGSGGSSVLTTSQTAESAVLNSTISSSTACSFNGGSGN